MLLRVFFKDGRNKLAWPTPGGVEIDIDELAGCELLDQRSMTLSDRNTGGIRTRASNSALDLIAFTVMMMEDRRNVWRF